MKHFYFIFLFIPFGIISMEPMLLDQKAKEEKVATALWPLPREICAKVAVAKMMKLPVIAQGENSFPWREGTTAELQAFSKTWLKTQMTPDNLFENQFWGSKTGTSLEFRYDNDTTNDCNIFELVSLGQDHLFGYDGPNNDGDSDQKIEGCHNGVILVGHSYTTPQGPKHAVYHLFKQHGLSIRDYQGVQKKTEIACNDGFALCYQGFPYTSEPLIGHSSVCPAIASGNRGAFVTVDEFKNYHLNVFEYTYYQNTLDASKPDQSFTTRIIAKADGLPHFKRLAWLYGKTLLGLSQEHELFVVAVDDQNSKVVCYKQKTDRKFKDFALGRPYCQHEIVLVDEQNKLYYVNLKNHDAHRNKGFSYKQVLNSVENSLQKKAKTAKPKAVLSQAAIDKIWIYGDLVGLKQSEAGPVHLGNKWVINYLSLRQARITAEDVKDGIAQLDKEEQQKKSVPEQVVVQTKEKKRRRKR